MFNINDDVISGICPWFSSINGKERYIDERVGKVDFDEAALFFSAVVTGVNCYEVRIEFVTDGNVHNYSCSCPAVKLYEGACKHVAALLYKIQDMNGRGEFNDARKRLIADNIFRSFQKKPATCKIPVRMEVTFDYSLLYKPERIYEDTTRYYSKKTPVNLRVGEETLYVIKDIKGFFDSIYNGEPVQFGKNFTFDPSVYEVCREDRAVYDFVNELYSIEKSGGRIDSSKLLFSENRLDITPALKKRLLGILADKTFRITIFHEVYENIRIIDAPLPVEFYLSLVKSASGRSKDCGDLVMSVDFKEPLLLLTEDGEYVFSEDAVYRTPKMQWDCFDPFYKAVLHQKSKHITIPKKDRERFFHEIIPFVRNAGELAIDNDLDVLVEKNDLAAEIYLDRFHDGILGEIRFIYGERTVNPFAGDEKNQVFGARIFLRDTEKEDIVLRILDIDRFEVTNDRFHINSAEMIFRFVFEVIPSLQQYCSVFYSEDFKKLVLKNPPVFRGRMALDEQAGMLEFSFGFDGIDPEELLKILGSIRERKKYYKLKDGRILPLNYGEFTKLAEVLEYLEPDKKDILKGMIRIPKYRALYLKHSMDLAGMGGALETNRAFRDLADHIGRAVNAEFEIPEELEGALRDYQRSGFRWLKMMSFCRLGGILADDMGLGKTIQVLSLLLSDKKNSILLSLVVVPSSLIYNWAAEIERFAPSLKVVIVSGDKEERKTRISGVAGNDVLITSYPLIRRDIDRYADLEFEHCFLDEAQYIKNPFTDTTQMVKRIKARKRFALTGTPMENSLRELWSIFDFILPGYLFSYSRFSSRYEIPITENNDGSAAEDLSAHIRPFILHRLKKDV